MAELVRMKLADAARHAGVSADTIRRAIRRKTIDAQRDNSGAWFVLMPADTDAATLMLRRRSAAYTEPEPMQNAAEHTGGEVQALKDHNETLKAQLAEMRQERERAEMWLIEERTRLQDQLQEARAEADHAKADQVRMARDVATMFDELRALADRQAELHADRTRLQADVDRLATELVQARRPWWRRWLKQ
jgi:DNA repair exonuclease SbcCD ATPase subunit